MDFQTIIGIIIGVCFLLVIIGGKRKKRDPKTSQASRAASSSYNSVRLLNREEERCFNRRLKLYS